MIKMEHKARFAEAFDRWFMSNELAVRACMDVLIVAHFWDDVVDQDRKVAPGEADEAMRKAMLELPQNPFWQDNIVIFLPVLQSIYLQWHAANVMERDQLPGDREKAYMLRASLYHLFVMVAAVCGGLDWAKEVAPQVYRLYGETVDSFMERTDA